MGFTPADDALVQVVWEDLGHIVSSWPEGEVDDATLRRESTVLRRFLAYDDLIKVWVTVMGRGAPFMVAASNVAVVDGKRLHQMDFCSSSEVRQPTGTSYSVLVKVGDLSEKMPVGLSRTAPMKLKKFIFGYSCVVQGVLIRRNDVVQFVANKLGGAHYDTGRQKPNDEALSKLGSYTVMDRDAVYYEMLAVGQALARSKSCSALLQRLERGAGEN